jgi:hypothetical protein
MARRRFGYCVVLVSVRKPGTPLHQPPDSARQLRTVLLEVACRQSVDRQHDHEGRGLRRRGRLRIRRGGSRRGEECSKD